MPKRYFSLLGVASWVLAQGCALLFFSGSGFAQQTILSTPAETASDVFVPAPDSDWMVPFGQSCDFIVHQKTFQIGSTDSSLVMLAHAAAGSGVAAEVQLLHTPASSSAISGLGIMSDARHALVIGLEDDDVVLWELAPEGVRVLSRRPIGHGLPLEFRVIGGSIPNARFYWRYKRERVWHVFGNPASYAHLSHWPRSAFFGLLVDGPLGSQAVFREYQEVPSVGYQEAAVR